MSVAFVRNIPMHIIYVDHTQNLGIACMHGTQTSAFRKNSTLSILYVEELSKVAA